eukprot:371430_1
MIIYGQQYEYIAALSTRCYKYNQPTNKTQLIWKINHLTRWNMLFYFINLLYWCYLMISLTWLHPWLVFYFSHWSPKHICSEFDFIGGIEILNFKWIKYKHW